MGKILDPQIGEQVQSMHDSLTKSALLTGHLASHFLAERGLLVFSGAWGVYKEPAPLMIAYSLAKQATHHIALNMATREEIPDSSSVVTILPETLDTPGNREAMPDADFSTWAKTDQVAQLLKMWANEENRPDNGAFVKLEVVNGTVSAVPATK